jgi:hypothetical protein
MDRRSKRTAKKIKRMKSVKGRIHALPVWGKWENGKEKLKQLWQKTREKKTEREWSGIHPEKSEPICKRLEEKN